MAVIAIQGVQSARADTPPDGGMAARLAWVHWHR